jgi:hypothetical protein
MGSSTSSLEFGSRAIMLVSDTPSWLTETKTRAVTWLRRLVVGLPRRRPGFAPEPVHVGFVVEKLALGQVFFPEFFGLPLSVSFHQGSMLIYYPWEEEYYHSWPQVRT